jgi:uncharacterized lipoprotein NlpE involved in copper resistance
MPFRFSALLLLPLALLGCRNQADQGEELAYLRMDVSEYDLPPIDTALPLMPTTPGTRWEYVVTHAQGEPTREVTKVISRNGKNALIESQEKGVIVSRDGYRIDDRGIWVTSILNGKTSLPITPPVPLLTFPIQEGKMVTWQGTVGTGATTMAGRAWTRVTRRQKIKTLAGEFLAYRVDMRTDLNGPQRSGALLISRWFAPGVGVVRIRATDAKTTIVKELIFPKNGNSSVTPGVK